MYAGPVFFKKVHKLVLFPFVRLFTLSLCIATFILLMQFLLIWFDELIGKDLGWRIYLQLFSYFGIHLTPQAFPLATLIASLMTLGELAEHNELTPLKSAGISTLRILSALFVFVVGLSGLVLYSNNYLVPKASIKAYTLLLDLRKKKPSLDIKEGVFYNGIPGYSIKVDKKWTDQKTLQGIMIYDHTDNKGNIALTTASQGRLYTLRNDQYLVLQLFDGHNYYEGSTEEIAKYESSSIPSFTRSHFDMQKVTFDLTSFKLTSSGQDIFSYHHSTKNAHEVRTNMAQIKYKMHLAQEALAEIWKKQAPTRAYDDVQAQLYLSPTAFTYLPSAPDTGLQTVAATQPAATDMGGVDVQSATYLSSRLSELCAAKFERPIIQHALGQARNTHTQLQVQWAALQAAQKELRNYEIEQYRRMASALGCLVMFLIGAPLGVLIRRGGIGVPLLISTLFILIYYATDMLGIRWAMFGILPSYIGPWLPNLALLPFGLLFLRWAYQDKKLSLKWKRRPTPPLP